LEILRQTLSFITHNGPVIFNLTVQHLSIVLVAVGLAVLTGVPIGIAITRNERAARVVLYAASILMTIPSMALFGVLIPILAVIHQGIGFLPAVIAIFLYSQLPIISNTYAAIRTVDPALREAAGGMGMTGLQRVLWVELPIAAPLIIAGIRIAVVINIGITAIAAYIGAGGLGFLIRVGITQHDARQVITGALCVSVLAIAADSLLFLAQRAVRPPGSSRR
jgi:osmoprotectant transport system permease protein